MPQTATIFAGLDGCTALVSLQIVNCAATHLASARWYSQLPQVCLAGSSFRDPQLVSVLQDAQRLILLDIISRNPHLQLQCADVLASLQRCTRLQDVHIETPDWRAPALHVANATLNLQRALLSVRFRFDGAASHCFGEAAADTSIGCKEGTDVHLSFVLLAAIRAVALDFAGPAPSQMWA